MLYSIPWFLILWPGHCGILFSGSLTWAPVVYLCKEAITIIGLTCILQQLVASHLFPFLFSLLFLYIALILLLFHFSLLPSPACLPSPSPSLLLLSLSFSYFFSPLFHTLRLNTAIQSLFMQMCYWCQGQAEHSWFEGWDIARRLPFVLIAFFVVLGRPSIILVSVVDLVCK